MAEFRFNLGDLVVTRISLAEIASTSQAGEYDVPHSYVVTERLLLECVGGVQLLYTCSRVGEAKRFHEEELEPRSAYDAQAHLDAWLSGRVKVADATSPLRWGGKRKEGM